LFDAESNENLSSVPIGKESLFGAPRISGGFAHLHLVSAAVLLPRTREEFFADGQKSEEAMPNSPCMPGRIAFELAFIESQM